MSTVAEKIKEVTSLYDKGNWGNALVLLRKITGAAPQERWKITNFIAWINWKQGLKINARNLWETIVYEEDCNKQILTSAHVGLSTHYANSNEREEALKHARLTLFFPPKEVTIKDTDDLNACAVALMAIGENDQAGILLREAMELNKILLNVAQDSSDLKIHEKIYEQLGQNARNLGKLMNT